MFATNVEAIKDFQLCARLYDYRYQDKVPETVMSRELAAQRYANTLRRVVAFFFYKRQAGITPSVNALLNRWEKLWFPKNMTAYDLAIEQHETWHNNLASFTTSAAASIMQFHEDFSNINADPILVEEPYDIPLTNEIKLQGSLDLVLRTTNKEYMVVMLSGQQKRPPMSSLLFDFAAMRYAFQYRSREKNPNVQYSLYDLGSAKPGFFEATPSVNDVKALIYWAKEIQSTDLFVPRRGFSAHCKGCSFDEPCSKWNKWPELKQP